MKKANIKTGTVFSIDIDQQRSLLAHIISHEVGALNSVICAFTLVRCPREAKDTKLGAGDVISVQFVTIDSFKLHNWKYVCNQQCDYLDSFIFALDLQGRQDVGFVGTKIRGGKIIESFLQACLGQRPWDAWHDPTYLDEFLAVGVSKPETVRYQKDFDILQ